MTIGSPPARRWRASSTSCANPRDVAPSFAYHSNVTLDRAVAMLNTPDYTMSTGTKAWRPQCRRPWDRGRSMSGPGPRGTTIPADIAVRGHLADPCAAIERIADFTGMSVDRACVETTAQACAFGAIRAEEDPTDLPSGWMGSGASSGRGAAARGATSCPTIRPRRCGDITAMSCSRSATRNDRFVMAGVDG